MSDASIETDICVIGAGSGGLSVAAAAAAFGVPVVLLEKGKMGGDCLNYGCVPSKALIASAKKAHGMRTAAKFGIAKANPRVDFQAVHDHIHGVIGAIAPNDSVERFTGLGVKVIQHPGRFVDRNTVTAGAQRIRARRFVIATGSTALVPPIPGLKEVPHLTNETLFDLTERPEHLIILGGGPIGMEIAQAMVRLGARVTVLEMAEPLGKDDPELTAVVLKSLSADGVDIRGLTKAVQVAKHPRGVEVSVEGPDGADSVVGSHLLVAAGRAPNVQGLGLDKAGIEFSNRGIKVNKGLKTTNSRVYAIGDVAGGLQFTHMANYHAGLVVRNALFKMPVKVSTGHIPWVTYTDPELAHVGETEASAAEKKIDFRVLRWPYAENDRAQAERLTDGLIKVITDKRGRIIGASIVGAQAGEIIQMWALAISQKLKIGAMTGYVSPYPTFTEIGKRAAVNFYKPSLSNPMLQRVIGFMRKLG
jgi:pyruvate/2-oxoglutarate dehydrogenase complex dihydrolipoamide dehydrogenase (E3) component